jgi:hypothetical protein
MALRIQTVEKDEFETVIPKLAALRINLFSDWPYLYDGSMAYEERYLRAYADSPGAVIGRRVAGNQIGRRSHWSAYGGSHCRIRRAVYS